MWGGLLTVWSIIEEKGFELMRRGKSVNVFFMDGDVNGRIKCNIPGWAGLAFKVPRTSLDLCKDRSELKQTGVYFLTRLITRWFILDRLDVIAQEK